MKIINGERGSGRTTILIHTAYTTGARIICPNRPQAKFVKEAAQEEGLEEKLKVLADSFDRTDKKPVTPESLKEAGFETEYLNAKCEECGNWKRDSQIYGHCTLRRCPVKAYERRQCQFFKKWEPKQKAASEAMCRNCKHFQVMDTRTGLCGEMDEIVFANSYRACFEPRKTNTERKCGDCIHGIAPTDRSVFCVAALRDVEADGIKAENCKWWEKRTAPLETAEKDWSKSKSCENCRFSTENDRPNPNTVTCHFKQNHPVLRPRDGSCWTCENYEPKPSTSKVEPKPAKPARSEKSCDNCDYSFVKDAKHPGCFTSALGLPCGSFKPIERPAPLGTDATH